MSYLVLYENQVAHFGYKSYHLHFDRAKGIFSLIEVYVPALIHAHTTCDSLFLKCVYWGEPERTSHSRHHAAQSSGIYMYIFVSP